MGCEAIRQVGADPTLDHLTMHDARQKKNSYEPKGWQEGGKDAHSSAQARQFHKTVRSRWVGMNYLPKTVVLGGAPVELPSV